MLPLSIDNLITNDIVKKQCSFSQGDKKEVILSTRIREVKGAIVRASSIADLNKIVEDVRGFCSEYWQKSLLKKSSRLGLRKKEEEITRAALDSVRSLDEAEKLYRSLPEWSNFHSLCAEKVAPYYSDVLRVMAAHEKVQSSPLADALLTDALRRRWNALIIGMTEETESIKWLGRLYVLCPPDSEAQIKIEEKLEQLLAKGSK